MYAHASSYRHNLLAPSERSTVLLLGGAQERKSAALSAASQHPGVQVKGVKGEAPLPAAGEQPREAARAPVLVPVPSRALELGVPQPGEQQVSELLLGVLRRGELWVLRGRLVLLTARLGHFLGAMGAGDPLLLRALIVALPNPQAEVLRESCYD